MILDTFGILLGIAVLILSIIAANNDWYDSWGYGVLRGLFWGLLAWVAFVVLVHMPISVVTPHFFETERKTLSALQDGNQTTGAFFLGTGVIDGEQQYTFYMNDKGGYKLANAPADQVTVYQDTDKPFLVRQTGCKTKVDWLVHCATDKRVIEIHVPKGTIKNNFVLDAN